MAVEWENGNEINATKLEMYKQRKKQTKNKTKKMDQRAT